MKRVIYVQCKSKENIITPVLVLVASTVSKGDIEQA